MPTSTETETNNLTYEERRKISVSVVKEIKAGKKKLRETKKEDMDSGQELLSERLVESLGEGNQMWGRNQMCEIAAEINSLNEYIREMNIK